MNRYIYNIYSNITNTKDEIGKIDKGAEIGKIE